MIVDLLQLAVSLATLAVVLWRRKTEAAAKSALGAEYARLAWAYAKDKGDESHALGAFRLIDSTADGKRDFTDAQARVFLDATKPKE